jgi:hypothetical protein
VSQPGPAPEAGDGQLLGSDNEQTFARRLWQALGNEVGLGQITKRGTSWKFCGRGVVKWSKPNARAYRSRAVLQPQVTVGTLPRSIRRTGVRMAPTSLLTQAGRERRREGPSGIEVQSHGAQHCSLHPVLGLLRPRAATGFRGAQCLIRENAQVATVGGGKEDGP